MAPSAATAVMNRQPLTNATNRPWQHGVKPPASRTAYASGNGASAVRSRSTAASPWASPTAATNATRSSSTVSRPTGAPFRSSMAPRDGEPQAPKSPTTHNPRGTTQRELFPSASSTGARASLNSTQPSTVSRSSTFARGFGPNRFAVTTGSFPALPTTTNVSLDSATFGSLLHARETKFLIPPFRCPSRPPGDTPDVLAAIATKDLRPAPDESVSDSPKAGALPNAKNQDLPTPSPDYFTIVFDLDETLCCNRGPGRAVLRPGCLDLLKSLRALSSPSRPIEIILWTASVESLARTVLVRLDPDGSIFSHLIFRDRRWFKETGYTKDLRLLGRDMKRVVIIENSPMSVALNREQSILVRDFLGHAPHDTDLKVVKEVLESWVTADRFVPIRDWLAQHPRVDRNNHVVAAPCVSAIAAGHGAALTAGYAATANSPTRARYGVPARGMPLRRW